MVALLVRWQGKGVQVALSGISWLSLLAAVGLYLASQLISAFKWKVLLNAALQAQQPTSQAWSTPVPADSRPTLSECYRLYLIGMFCNLWLPTSVGGDAVRAALAGKRWGNLSLAATSILVERITGLLALLAIGAVGWLLWWPQTTPAANHANSNILWPAISALLATGVLGLLLLALRRCAFYLETRSASRLVASWAKVHRALDLFASPQLRPTLFKALALSLVFQSTQIGLNLFLARAVGLDLPAVVFLWLVPSLAIASMIPLGVGGLGVREAAAITLLQGALPPAMAPSVAAILAWSLLGQATLWLSGLPGAVAYFAQKEKSAP